MALDTPKPELGADPGQVEVVAFLSSPAAYEPAPVSVERIVTHAAMVFLAGDEAYKIKRAVTYSYLDFSTLEKRLATCKHEFEINRDNAPGLYLGVVPIVRRSDGKLSIGGIGDIIEWAVRMRRFEAKNLLSNLYASNPPSDPTIRDLAEAVVRLHRGAMPLTTPDGAARIGAIVEELRDALAEHPGRLPAEAVERFIELADTELDRNRLCLKLRGRRGCIRRCHGDLHLGNIVAIDGEPVLFDAIEFDDEMATIDVLYDLAFLLMDLDIRGFRRSANMLLNRYLTLSKTGLDLYGLAALPLFMGLRAAIRAMVALQRGHDRQADDEAWRYLDRALGYLKRVRPRLIAVGGCSGTGKSTLARGLAPLIGRSPGAVHLSSDSERKELAGVPELQRLGPAGYTPEVTAAVYRRLQSKATRALRSGCSVVVDATFLRPQDRGAIEAVAGRVGVTFTGVWLATLQPLASARVASRQADASDATTDVVERQFAATSPPEDWIAVDASGTIEQTLAAAALRLCEHNSRSSRDSEPARKSPLLLQCHHEDLFCTHWCQTWSTPCSPTIPIPPS